MSARNNILQKLRSGLVGTTPRPDDFDERLVTEPWQYNPDDRIRQLRTQMEAVHTELYQVTSQNWPEKVAEVLAARNLGNLLHAPGTEHGSQLAEYWQSSGQSVELLTYDRPIEEWKDELFWNVDASVTGTLGAIAATGSLVVWPDRMEPRLMSLLPPLHIALLKASEIEDNLYTFMKRNNWSAGMPTNLLLVSGPSKTADIEQVLAFGAHGPKELVVLILEDA
ncbi:lactate utilization protein C [Marinobacter salinexigens]|uniref:Lactate utilization protein C n=1 Tax=Marinobacter salinexigens TaxID=2919747 RepID=A0A5B0VKH8_9GAMM|nr:lactate utilization protein C [Marinobacter salinexigens]KAA1174439.1 lactate utilization protein C [Marinobacter salinexigens]